MRRAITTGFDYSQFDDADDVMEKIIDALKRLDIQAFLTYHPDNPDITSVDLYKFLDEAKIVVEPCTEQIFVENEI